LRGSCGFFSPIVSLGSKIQQVSVPKNILCKHPSLSQWPQLFQPRSPFAKVKDGSILGYDSASTQVARYKELFGNEPSRPTKSRLFTLSEQFPALFVSDNKKAESGHLYFPSKSLFYYEATIIQPGEAEITRDNLIPIQFYGNVFGPK
jgi:hypothetical protein